MEEIEKKLDLEDQITDSIAYFPLAGASAMSNFRSPDAFVLIFFEKAKGWHSVDFSKFKTKSNQIHISFPGQIHSWETQPGAKGHKLILSKAYVEKILNIGQFNHQRINSFPVLNITEKIAKKLNLDFIALKNELDTTSPSKRIVDLRVQVILTIVAELLDNKEIAANQTHPTLAKYLQLVEENFKEERKVTFYATAIGLTSNYLNIIVRRYMNMSPKDLIELRTVLEAKRLLLGTDKSIKEIAYELNFREVSAFTTFMSRNTGLPPSDYRTNDATIYGR